jgi:serine/threonine protein kinase/tetratricopeptide (TPR) repeat protein
MNTTPSPSDFQPQPPSSDATAQFVWERIKEIVHQCIDMPEADRAVFIEAQCGNDALMKSQVEDLLKNTTLAGFILDEPLVAQRPDLAMNAHAPLIGSQVGAYQLIGLLGRGGMGEVYRAIRIDRQFEHEVAIKLVTRQFEQQKVIDRFLSERQILATLTHPNIARLLDGGTTTNGTPYFVMELVEGLPIHEYCERHRLGVSERITLFLKICAAVQHAHQRLIVHRDLKPSNIIVTCDGEPKLLDFGIAKIISDYTDPTITITAEQAFTPQYSSPEQVRGEPITTATDVYSLGVVLYQLLTAKSPYDVPKTDRFAMAKAICETVPEAPSALRARIADANTTALKINGDLDSITLKALRKDPERRYATIQQFAEDLHNFTQGMPVSARDSTWRYRTARFVKRHVWAVTASALASVAIIGLAAFSTWQAHVATKEKERAERHFASVRTLVNSLVFDVYESIQDLAGAAPAGQHILSVAKQYLETLRTDMQGNHALQKDLATTYGRLGQTQFDLGQPNTGNVRDAMENFGIARGILLDLAAANFETARSTADAALAQNYFAKALISEGKNEEAIAMLDIEVQRLEDLASSFVNDINVKQVLSSLLELRADLHAGDYGFSAIFDLKAAQADLSKSVALRTDLLAIFSSTHGPHDRRTLTKRHNLHVLQLREAHLLARQAQFELAFAKFDETLKNAKALLSQEPTNSRYKSIYVETLLIAGHSEFLAGNKARGLEYIKAANAETDWSSKSFENSSHLMDGIAYNTALVGAYMLSGEKAKALETSERLSGLLKLVDQKSVGRLDFRRTMVAAWLKIGQASAASAKHESASVFFEKVVAAQQAPKSFDELLSSVDARLGLARIKSEISPMHAVRELDAANSLLSDANKHRRNGYFEHDARFLSAISSFESACMKVLAQSIPHSTAKSVESYRLKLSETKAELIGNIKKITPNAPYTL